MKELRNNLQRSTAECKTPNCVTPNRKIRCVLGRTPEKLYSPFAIETPPSLKWHKFPESSDDRFANFYGWFVLSVLSFTFILNPILILWKFFTGPLHQKEIIKAIDFELGSDGF